MRAKKSLLFITIVIVIAGASYFLFKIFTPAATLPITTVVDTGTVQQLVSVSGVATAADTAELAFLNSGTVTEVLVEEGDEVVAGTVLAVLKSTTQQADRQEALASVKQAEADLRELRAGLTATGRSLSAETVLLKEAQLKTIESTEESKVQAARDALLAGEVIAYTPDGDEEAVAPIITGTYECAAEGTYELALFRSRTNSGYSYRLSGLETGTFEASFDQTLPLGTCGLRARFSAGSTYGETRWYIDIPNKKSSTYINRKNAYDVAVEQAKSAVALATQEVALAKASAADVTAIARPEAIARAEAALLRAQAGVARIDADIANQTLRAPFSGTVVRVSIVAGETAGTAPIITLLSPERYELKARIPEIDIGKLTIGQRADIVFDTSAQETLTALIDYLSPEATTIDGVAYYEARLVLSSKPVWLRSGLNADIDIIVAEETNAVRVPKRFIIETTPGVYAVLAKATTGVATSTVNISFTGNDGYVAVTGISAGDELIAP